MEANREGTGLIELAELKRAQETAALVRQHYQQHPGAALGGGGPQSLLGSPDLAMAPGGGPMPALGLHPVTQQTVLPGQAPQPPQPVPGGQDLSQFAGSQGAGSEAAGGGRFGSGSTLSSLLPAPSLPAQPHPLEALMRLSPDAAFAVMQRSQQQQERQWKIQEQRLTWGLKGIEAVAQMSQGVTSQEDLDRARTDMQQLAPQAAARLPQFYTTAGMEAFQQQALSVKEAQTLKLADLHAQSDAVKAQADLLKARREGRSVDVDNQLKAMGVQPGQETPAHITEALRQVEEGKVRVSAAQGQGQIKETPFGAVRVGKSGETEFIQAPGGGPLYGKPTEAEQKAATYYDLAKRAQATTGALEAKGFQPGFWAKVGDKLPLGLGNYLTSEEHQSYKQGVGEFAAAWLRKTSGANVTPSEWEMTDQIYFPQPGNSKAQIEQKRQAREAIVRNLEEEARPTGRTATGGSPPTSQPPAGTSGQGGGTFLSEADIAATMQASGKTRQQVLDAAKAKGYTLPRLS
jgi:hypothetical protein